MVRLDKVRITDSDVFGTEQEEEEEDGHSVEFSIDPKMWENLGIQKPLIGEELDEFAQEKIYYYQLRKDLEKLRSMGGYKATMYEYLKKKENDANFQMMNDKHPLGQDGNFAEVSDQTADMRWRQTTLPYGIIANKRFIYWKNNLPAGPSADYLRAKEQVRQDFTLWDQVRFDTLNPPDFKVKEEANRIRKEVERMQKKVEISAEDLAKKTFDQRKHDLQLGNFESLRFLPTKREFEDSLQNWNKGHHLVSKIESEGFPKIEDLSIGGKASFNVDKSRNGLKQILRRTISTRKYIQSDAQMYQEFLKWMMGINIQRAKDYLKKVRKERKVAARRLAREQKKQQQRDQLLLQQKEATKRAMMEEQRRQLHHLQQQSSEITKTDGLSSSEAQEMNSEYHDERNDNDDEMIEMDDNNNNDNMETLDHATTLNGSNDHTSVNNQSFQDMEFALEIAKEEGCLSILQFYYRRYLARYLSVGRRRNKRIYMEEEGCNETLNEENPLGQDGEYDEDYDELNSNNNQSAIHSFPQKMKRIARQSWNFLTRNNKMNNKKRKLRGNDDKDEGEIDLFEDSMELEGGGSSSLSQVSKDSDAGIGKLHKQLKNTFVYQQCQVMITAIHRSVQRCSEFLVGKKLEKKFNILDEANSQKLEGKEAVLRENEENEKLMDLIIAARAKEREKEQQYQRYEDYFSGINRVQDFSYIVEDLLVAVKTGNYRAVIDILEFEGRAPDPNECNEEGDNAIYAALMMILRQESYGKKSDLEDEITWWYRIKRLFQKKVEDPNFDLVLRLLLYKGGNINYIKQDKDGDGLGIIHHTAQLGSLDFLRWLVHKGIDIHARTTRTRKNALMIAVEKQHLSMILYLLEIGCMPRLTKDVDIFGWSVLHYAAAFADVDINQVLLICGANPLQRSEVTGKSPMEEAQSRGRNAVLETLRTYRDHYPMHKKLMDFQKVYYKDKVFQERDNEDEDDDDDEDGEDGGDEDDEDDKDNNNNEADHNHEN